MRYHARSAQGHEARPRQQGPGAGLPIAAVSHNRFDTPGQAYDRRKLAEHLTPGEAGRARKRPLPNDVFQHLLADARAREVVRGGQVGTELASA